jgi:peptide methionine sulfoxide reductase msrA/msrB
LTPQEQNIILNKGTEYPFSGKYNKFYEDGLYECRHCGAPLFKSSQKFDSRSGWPSFDDSLYNSVREIPDKDGRRVEIVCAKCGGHLGHVFKGEQMTSKDTRHCVNSLSLNFVPTSDKRFNKAYFAGGCFWGVEYFFENLKGVISAVSGYMGGDETKATYQEVSKGDTGHLEVIEIAYDNTQTTYENLLKLFMQIHDFSQTNGQGPDIGAQYLSAVFTSDKEELKTIKKVFDTIEKMGYKVATTIRPLAKFFKAEDYHQDYYQKKNSKPYCHVFKKLF